MSEAHREVANLTERTNPDTPFLAGNDYPDSPHSQGDMKFATQISSLLNYYYYYVANHLGAYQKVIKDECNIILKLTKNNDIFFENSVLWNFKNILKVLLIKLKKLMNCEL